MSEYKFILREMTEEDRVRERARIREIAMRDRASDLEAARLERERKEQKIAQDKAEFVKSLMHNINCDAETAMQLLGIPDEEREKYLRLINPPEEKASDNAKPKFILREMTEEDRIRERARIREIAMRDRASDLESARAEGKAEGEAKGRVETIKSFMRALNLSAAEAMTAAGIPAGEQAKYLPLLG